MADRAGQRARTGAHVGRSEDEPWLRTTVAGGEGGKEGTRLPDQGTTMLDGRTVKLTVEN